MDLALPNLKGLLHRKHTVNWNKLGRIFNPVDHLLPNNCMEFAQGPQALVFDDFIRVYFSTREVDHSVGKAVSHIAFADFTKDFARVLRVSRDTVIARGGLGCFDEHGIFPMNVVRRGNEVYGYTCGWNRRSSVSVDTAIGLAVSRDNGLTFGRVGPGPIIGPSMHEPFLVGDPYVLFDGTMFRMWYIFGTKWRRYVDDVPADRTYKIGYSVSADGVSWRPGCGVQIIADSLNPDEAQAMPTVLKRDGLWHMFFCFRESFDFRTDRSRGYRLGYAWSEDGESWTRDDARLGICVLPGEWDSDMQCYPHVFECDGRAYLLYNGNQFGRYGFGAAVLA